MDEEEEDEDDDEEEDDDDDDDDCDDDGNVREGGVCGSASFCVSGWTLSGAGPL